MPELKPGQFEVQIAVYGYVSEGVRLNRQTAEHMAAFAKGKYVSQIGAIFTIPTGLGVVGCIIATHLEDDTPDGTKGRVIAICEPVELPTRTVYRCSKCGYELVVKQGQITTSDVKMHCGLIMQATKHPEPYKPPMEYK